MTGTTGDTVGEKIVRSNAVGLQMHPTGDAKRIIGQQKNGTLKKCINSYKLHMIVTVFSAPISVTWNCYVPTHRFVHSRRASFRILPSAATCGVSAPGGTGWY